MYQFLHPLFGEYVVRLHGQSVLPFLKQLTSDHILFWGLRGEQSEWQIKTSLACAEPLLACAEEAGIDAEIVGKHGLPFLIAKYKRRPGLLLGLFLGFALLFYAELFVWKITVNGNTLLSDREIIHALEDYGIGIGSYIPSIPVLRAQNEFLLEYADISSVAINIKGTHIEVEVLERTHAPEIENTDGYCNIVASEDGIILSVDVAAGTALVSPGDVVTAGQPLISAYTVNGRQIYQLHHARGTVTAEVYGSYSIAIPLESTVKQYTGREEKKTTLTLLGKDLDLFWKEDCPYDRFDTEVSETPFFLFGIAETPIVSTSVIYREYQAETVTISPEQAQQAAFEAFNAWLDRQTDEITDYDYKISYDEIQNAYVLNASVVFRKNIGVDLPISAGELPPEQIKPREVQ